jgi:hypothetical protein
MKTLLLTILAFAASAQHSGPRPETVMVTCHAKSGAEAELQRVLTRHWTTVRDLKLVRDAPHMSLRGVENGETYFVEIFTWRDAAIPDHAPAPVQAIWAEMNKLVDGRGIEIAVVTPY